MLSILIEMNEPHVYIIYKQNEKVKCRDRYGTEIIILQVRTSEQDLLVSC